MDFSITIRDILLFGHIGAAIILLGPFIVATSLFPRYFAEVSAEPANIRVLQVLHRISSGYGNAAIIVAILGVALTFDGDLWSEAFVQIAIALFVLGGGLIFAGIVPAQVEAIRLASGPANADETQMRKLLMRLRATAGVNSLLWGVILLVMVVKP